MASELPPLSAAFARGQAWKLAADTPLPPAIPAPALPAPAPTAPAPTAHVPALEALQRRSWHHRVSPAVLGVLEAIALFTVVMLAGLIAGALASALEGRPLLSPAGGASFAAATALAYVLIRSLPEAGSTGADSGKIFFFCRRSDRFLAAFAAALLFAAAYGQLGSISLVWLAAFAALGLAAALLAEAASWRATKTALGPGTGLGRHRALIADAETIKAHFATRSPASAPHQWEATLAYDGSATRPGLDEGAVRLIDAFDQEVRAKAIEEFFILTDRLPPAFVDYLLTRLARRACRFHFLYTNPLEELSVDGTMYGLNVKIGKSRCTLATRALDDDDASTARNMETCTLTTYALRPHEMFAKRALDVAAALVGLTLFAPLLAVTWVAIKLDSKGPFFFRQPRGGFNQVDFLIWKLRTMTTTETDGDVKQAQRNDPRITRVGAFLRKYNIDELPQLINVLRGEMSLVGPRPHALSHDLAFTDRAENYVNRFRVLPGITGWAQIHGFRGPILSNSDLEKRVDHDLEYMRNWSLSLDLYILLMTVVSRRAYRNAL